MRKKPDYWDRLLVSQPRSLLTTELHCKALLDSLGIALDTDHTSETPKRMAKMLFELTATKEMDPRLLLRDKLFPSTSDEMVIESPITNIIGLCSHHMLPVTYTAHVGYVPNGYVVGLSKIPRFMHLACAHPSVQEDLSQAITDSLWIELKASGVMVILQGVHSCMTCRGVKSNGTVCTTSVVRGVFADTSRHAREEFLSLVRHNLI